MQVNQRMRSVPQHDMRSAMLLRFCEALHACDEVHAWSPCALMQAPCEVLTGNFERHSPNSFLSGQHSTPSLLAIYNINIGQKHTAMHGNTRRLKSAAGMCASLLLRLLLLPHPWQLEALNLLAQPKRVALFAALHVACHRTHFRLDHCLSSTV